MLDLLVALLAMILYRVALLTICAAVGILIARAVSGRARLFWLAAGIHATFHWLIVAVQLAIGEQNPGAILVGQASLLTSSVTVIYYLASFALAYLWLRRTLSADVPLQAAARRQR